MASVLKASHIILDTADDLFKLAWLRLDGAPVDDELLSKIAEISHALDEIRDNIAEGVE